ncbi:MULTISPECIES: hypothetical protein [Bacillus]|uniref:Uncharacterized protein n=1 Tax=Bacillus cereus TaxID=1396 RepID=A0A9X6BAH6_BACCE|nr:hypothetical protein [Bacillus cereus]OOR74857.1 hypothetical protein BLX06_11520 [Bacillus cereus]
MKRQKIKNAMVKMVVSNDSFLPIPWKRGVYEKYSSSLFFNVWSFFGSGGASKTILVILRAVDFHPIKGLTGLNGFGFRCKV